MNVVKKNRKNVYLYLLNTTKILIVIKVIIYTVEYNVKQRIKQFKKPNIK